MTIAEVNRAIQSRNRIQKQREKEKASYDYVLASLIVKGVSITLGSKDKYPSIQEAYVGVFEDQEEKQQEAIQEQKDKLSALRFLQFAQSHNQRFKEEVPKEENE
jgi:hypothetical protein